MKGFTASKRQTTFSPWQTLKHIIECLCSTFVKKLQPISQIAFLIVVAVTRHLGQRCPASSVVVRTSMSRRPVSENAKLALNRKCRCAEPHAAITLDRPSGLSRMPKGYVDARDDGVSMALDRPRGLSLGLPSSESAWKRVSMALERPRGLSLWLHKQPMRPSAAVSMALERPRGLSHTIVSYTKLKQKVSMALERPRGLSLPLSQLVPRQALILAVCLTPCKLRRTEGFE